MTVAPELEAKFQRHSGQVSAGSQTFGRDPDAALWAGDVIGSITRELVEEVARRTGQTHTFNRRGGDLLLHAASQANGQRSCSDLHQHQLHAEWRGTFGSIATKRLGIGHKETTSDGRISLEEVECIGACSWAPAMQVNYDFHHQVTPEKLNRCLLSYRDRVSQYALQRAASALKCACYRSVFGPREFAIDRRLSGERRLSGFRERVEDDSRMKSSTW